MDKRKLIAKSNFKKVMFVSILILFSIFNFSYAEPCLCAPRPADLNTVLIDWNIYLDTNKSEDAINLCDRNLIGLIEESLGVKLNPSSGVTISGSEVGSIPQHLTADFTISLKTNELGTKQFLKIDSFKITNLTKEGLEDIKLTVSSR